MAWLKPNKPGQKSGLQYDIANLEGVQDYLDTVVFKAEVAAEEEVAKIRASEEYTGDLHVFIEVERGDIDRYLILNDTNGQNAAMSIEFGRSEYEVEREDGTVYRIAGMEGKGILHKAFGVHVGALRGTGGGEL